jgi:hypothetical protein
MVIALALMLVFFFKLPANIWPCYVKKDDNLIAPKTFFTGILFLTGLGCFLALFGNAIFLLWKRFGITLLNSISALPL